MTLAGPNGPANILAGVNFTLKAGEFVSVLGGSGTGKTTLLRVLGGLQSKSGGTVTFEGGEVSGPPEGVVTIFQDYAQSLLPWRTVASNVALGIEATKSKEEVSQRVAESLELVGLAANARDYPWSLSGGMQQRVQIARALAMQPKVLLMDEPFGALDALTKASLQDQLQQVQQMTGASVVFVTHDVEEAVYLSDRVVMLSGRPATISLELQVDLPRPRTQIGTRESEDFLRLRHRALDALGVGGQHA